MDKREAFWDGVAERYSARPIDNVPAYELTMERVRHYLQPEDRVLEVGCGTGSTALLLAPHLGHIWASDISGEMLRIGKQKAEKQGAANVTFLHGDLFADNLASEAPYDRILAFNLLHLVEDLPASIARLHGLLKPGGLLISKTPCLSGVYLFLAVPIFFMRLVGKAPPVTHISQTRLHAMMTDAGFEIEESSSFLKAKVSRFIVARKR